VNPTLPGNYTEHEDVDEYKYGGDGAGPYTYSAKRYTYSYTVARLCPGVACNAKLERHHGVRDLPSHSVLPGQVSVL